MEKVRLAVISLLTIMITIVVGWYSPWWSFVPVCLLLGYCSKLVPIKAFSTGFFCIFAAWLLQAYYIDLQNESILTARIGRIFEGVNLLGLLLITGTFGGLGGGLAFAAGSSTRNLIKKSA
ncbi:MAG: hypothetical protein EA409_06345 [Saprospirales bacterium]|nr:MAG: hypothetical protein EA409_06345 [Saprospirales bacterium]